MISGFAQLQRNEELGFDLRTLVAGGLGVSAIQTNDQLLVVTAGLSAQREVLVDSSSPQDSLEILAAMRYENFRYHKPKRDISIDFTAYPSLTEPDRIRIELNAKLRIEVVNDLNVGLSLLESYDSNPPTEGAEKSTSR